MTDLVTHHGGCHCGRICFEVDAPAVIDALECNCSICRMTGFVHPIVPASRFRLIGGAGDLTGYFCAVCGVKPFYVPRSNPDGYDVDVDGLARDAIASVRVGVFDDTRRDESDAAIRPLTQ